jgi:pyrroline-5-carboxylate reductase
MGEAMVRGILSEELIGPSQIVVSDLLPERRAVLGERYGVDTTDDSRMAIRGRDLVVLAIKPQTLSAVMDDLQGELENDQLILSIVAGASISTLCEGLKHAAIVRAMPNTPAQIGEGICVWTASEQVTQDGKDTACAILRSLGSEICVDDESLLDMATALNATGPAYVFLFMEALIDAGVHMGFSRRVAITLVMETVRGSVLYAQQSGLHPAQLRNMVTSPGGTTAEALYQLDKGGFRTVLSKAVWAAYKKAKYLGGLAE